jgi:hypothetical protein
MRVVVQKPDGSPATDAIVVFTARSDDEAARTDATKAFPADEVRRYAAQAASGTRLLLDERGATRVPKGGYVFAFAGDLAVRASVANEPAEPRLVLKLLAPRRFTVEVVDADGKPAAGVPIAVRNALKHEGGRLHETAADGTLAVCLLNKRPDTAIVLADIATRAPLHAPLPAPSPTAADATTTDARVRLQLPPTTTVEATLQGELAPGCELAWTLQLGDTGARIAGERSGERTGHWRFVEAGTPATCRVGIGSVELAQARGDVVAGGTALTLARTFPTPAFALQLLEETGEPARDRTVSLNWRTARRSHGERHRTTRDGWLELQLPTTMATEKKVDLTLDLYAGSASDQLIGSITLALQPAGNVRTALTPAAMQPVPVLASGKVVDAAGQPVANLQLTFRGSQWQRTKTAADGTFTVRGEKRNSPRVRVGLEGDWVLAAEKDWSREVEAGSQDLRLVVERVARVRFGSDLKGNLTSILSCRLESASDPAKKVDVDVPWGERTIRAPAGHWHFVALADGEELLRLPDLRCDSGVETHDPRFMAFDWRAFAVLVEVTVKTASGDPTDECTVWVHTRNVGHGSPPQNGVARFLLPKAGARVEVAPRDPKLTKIELGVVTENQIVVLGGGPALTVALQPMPELPPGIELVLAIDDGDGVAFDKNGMALVLAQKPGPVTPRIRVRRGTTTSAPLDWQLPEIDVPKDGKKFAVELTAERKAALATSIERAQRQ